MMLFVYDVRNVVSPPPALPSDSSRLLSSFDSQDSVEKIDSYEMDDSRYIIKLKSLVAKSRMFLGNDKY